MIIQVRLFASLREQLGCGVVEVNVGASQISVADLLEQLIETHGESWRRELTAPNVLYAVNREVVVGAAMIKVGDEVAFFPPVTGG